MAVSRLNSPERCRKDPAQASPNTSIDPCIYIGWSWIDELLLYIVFLLVFLRFFKVFHTFPFHAMSVHSWAPNWPAFSTSLHLHGAASAATALLSRGTGWAAERANIPLMEPFLGEAGCFLHGQCTMWMCCFKKITVHQLNNLTYDVWAWLMGGFGGYPSGFLVY